MLGLLSKSWKSTRSASTHHPSRLLPQCRPCFSSQVSLVPNKSFSTPAGQGLDKATLHDFKRVLALRQEFERCDGVDIFHNQYRYAWKLIHEGTSCEKIVPTVMKAVRKAVDLNFEYHEVVSELCKTEYRKKQKQKEKQREMEMELEKKMEMDLDAHPWLKSFLCGQPDQSIMVRELIPIVSQFEALLEADAAQQRPLLNGPEREVVKDVLKEHLKRRRSLFRADMALFLAFVSLGVGGLYWLDDWVKRHPREEERDFKELHTGVDDVE